MLLKFVSDPCYVCLVFADVGILANKVFMSLQAVNDTQDQLAVIDKLEHSYVSAAMRQLVCLLNNYIHTYSICQFWVQLAILM